MSAADAIILALHRPKWTPEDGSCLANLLFLLDKSSSILDELMQAELRHLDFSKAFALVDHRLKFLKWRGVGTGGRLRIG